MEPETLNDESIVDQEVGALAEQVQTFVAQFYFWVDENVLTLLSLFQIVAMVGTMVLALMVRRPFKRFLNQLGTERDLGGLILRLLRTVGAIAMPMLWAIGLAIADAVFSQLGMPTAILHLVGILVRAYVIIRIATIFIPSAYWSGVFAWAAWTVAAVNAVGFLDPAIEAMRSAGFTIGQAEVNLWTVVKGLLLSAGLVWLAFAASEMIQRRLEQVETLNSALRLLIGKITRIFLVVIAVVVGLVAVGVDLTAFAVFSVAIGIGVGLGLQRTISNLVASFSLLADKSLKPGDVIELETTEGATYGVVGKMTTRYVSVRTRDGAETLIPNETLIANPVTNWSYSDKTVRRKIGVGVGYGADVDLAIELCLQAAKDTPRILKTRSRSVC